MITVIGAGLAGCEAAWQAAEFGAQVKLYEMKPDKRSPAHHSDGYAELVCSNSLRSESLSNAPGLLKEEMRRLGSLIIRCADETRVGAGGALAVDREGFSRLVTERIKSYPRIETINREITEIPEGTVIIAAGPLCSDALSQSIERLTGGQLYFYDAAAPLISAGSIDMGSAFFAARYNKGEPDYINCPMNEDEYKLFVGELRGAKQAEVRGFEDSKVFEGCMPVEVMARRGEDTLRYGPLKPRGIFDPATGEQPYAVVQLRRDNAAGNVYNIVGFQTHLTWPEQKRVFSLIPALKKAEFLRYGVMHRNTYIDSPRLLDKYYRLRSGPSVRFAGQITGVEGYIESAASGLVSGLCAAFDEQGLAMPEFSRRTAIGSLGLYVSDTAVADFQPMNINFGIITPLGVRVRGKQNKNRSISERALDEIDKVRAALGKAKEAYESNS